MRTSFQDVLRRVLVLGRGVGIPHAVVATTLAVTGLVIVPQMMRGGGDHSLLGLPVSRARAFEVPPPGTAGGDTTAPARVRGTSSAAAAGSGAGSSGTGGEAAAMSTTGTAPAGPLDDAPSDDVADVATPGTVVVLGSGNNRIAAAGFGGAGYKASQWTTGTGGSIGQNAASGGGGAAGASSGPSFGGGSGSGGRSGSAAGRDGSGSSGGSGETEGDDGEAAPGAFDPVPLPEPTGDENGAPPRSGSGGEQDWPDSSSGGEHPFPGDPWEDNEDPGVSPGESGGAADPDGGEFEDSDSPGPRDGAAEEPGEGSTETPDDQLDGGSGGGPGGPHDGGGGGAGNDEAPAPADDPGEGPPDENSGEPEEPAEEPEEEPAPVHLAPWNRKDAAGRVVGWLLIGGSSSNEANRRVGWNIKSEGWSGFIQKVVRPQLEWGSRRFLLHNPFGTHSYEAMQFTQYLQAQAEGLTWLTEGFVEAWRPVIRGDYTNGEPVEVICYFGSLRADKMLRPLYEDDRLDEWFELAREGLQPAVDAGMTIGLDAVVLADAEHPCFAFANQLRDEGKRVYVETFPYAKNPHWAGFHVIVEEGFYLRNVVGAHVAGFVPRSGMPGAEVIRLESWRPASYEAYPDDTWNWPATIRILTEGDTAGVNLRIFIRAEKEISGLEQELQTLELGLYD